MVSPTVLGGYQETTVPIGAWSYGVQHASGERLYVSSSSF